MKRPHETTPVTTDFRLSNPPVETSWLAGNGEEEAGNSRQLPRSYGRPIVCALARNPTSLFVYWEVDWPSLFALSAPRNRQVYLILQDSDGAEVSRVVVEPMVGNSEVSVPRANRGYRVELGYFDVAEVWHSAGSANVINTPNDNLSEPAATTFATVPFHLGFQRLADLFRASTVTNRTIIEQVAQLQKQASTPEGFEVLSLEEAEILGALNASLPNDWREKMRNPGREINLERRLGEILGFGSSSPANSPGGSSGSH